MTQSTRSCKPAAFAMQLRIYAGRDTAALLGTHPVLSGGERARTPQRKEHVRGCSSYFQVSKIVRIFAKFLALKRPRNSSNMGSNTPYQSHR